MGCKPVITLCFTSLLEFSFVNDSLLTQVCPPCLQQWLGYSTQQHMAQGGAQPRGPPSNPMSSSHSYSNGAYTAPFYPPQLHGHVTNPSFHGSRPQPQELAQYSPWGPTVSMESSKVATTASDSTMPSASLGVMSTEQLSAAHSSITNFQRQQQDGVDSSGDGFLHATAYSTCKLACICSL